MANPAAYRHIEFWYEGNEGAAEFLNYSQFGCSCQWRTCKTTFEYGRKWGFFFWETFVFTLGSEMQPPVSCFMLYYVAVHCAELQAWPSRSSAHRWAGGFGHEKIPVEYLVICAGSEASFFKVRISKCYGPLRLSDTPCRLWPLSVFVFQYARLANQKAVISDFLLFYEGIPERLVISIGIMCVLCFAFR